MQQWYLGLLLLLLFLALGLLCLLTRLHSFHGSCTLLKLLLTLVQQLLSAQQSQTCNCCCWVEASVLNAADGS